MARFERQAVLTGLTTNAGAYEADATNKLKGIFESATEFGLKRHEQQRIQDAKFAAGSAELTPGEGLERESTQSLYGRVYNQVVENSYKAATRNDYTKRINEIALENPMDSVAYQTQVEAYRSKTLSGVPADMQNFMSADMNSTINNAGHRIRVAEAEDTIKTGIMEADQATEGLYNDGINDLRQGNDDDFLMRRQAYVESVTARPELSDSQKLARIQKFDKAADTYYHIGTVERFLANGDYEAATRYKQKLAQGNYKSFGESKADRDVVMAELDKKISNYYQNFNLVETQDQQAQQQRYNDNTNMLAKGFLEGDILGSDIDQAWKDGGIDFGSYKLLKSFQTSAADTVTSPGFNYDFAIQAENLDDSALKEYLHSAVTRGEVNRDEAAEIFNKINTGTYSVLKQAAPKRELAWLRSAMQMDISFINIPGSPQALMSAEAYKQAQESIIAGMEPSKAVKQAFTWRMNEDNQALLNLDIYSGVIREEKDVEKAREYLEEAAPNMSEADYVRYDQQLNGISHTLKALGSE